MYETSDDLASLDELLTASLRGAGEHLRSIVTEGDRTLDAAQTAAVLTGMRTLAVSTVTASGEPRVSGEDGHFLHARWVFTTSGTAVKARHLRARPAVSVAHIAGDDLGIFCETAARSSSSRTTRTSRRSRSTWSGTTVPVRAAGDRTSPTCGCSRTGWCPSRSRRTGCSRPPTDSRPATARGRSAADGSHRRSRAGARRSRTTGRCGRRRRAADGAGASARAAGA